MAVYKVPQDVEAEDKLLGPLTLKQFIFTIITIILCYLAFLFGKANLALVLPFLPPIGLFGYLAAPFQRDQPTDVYLGARLRFLIKPRLRIWNQAGIEQLVQITVPKKVEVQLTNNLQPSEVRSRLSILASTIDSRGWTTKNAYVNDPADPDERPTVISDRLVAVANQPTDVPETDITAADDMLDPASNRLAHHMDQLATQSKTDVRDEALAQMHAAQAGQAPATTPSGATLQPQAPVPSAALVNSTPAPAAPRIQSYPTNHALLTPYPQSVPQVTTQPVAAPTTTAPAATSANENQTNEQLPQSAKIGLAQRDDLSVETIAREASRVVHGDDEEVVIHLH